MKTVTITHWEENWDNYRPTSLLEYIEWLNEKLREIPEEYRPTARVEIDSESSYGSASLEYRIVYERPETNEEKILREGRERQIEESKKAHEIEQLKQLKAKYPNMT